MISQAPCAILSYIGYMVINGNQDLTNSLAELTRQYAAHVIIVSYKNSLFSRNYNGLSMDRSENIIISYSQPARTVSETG